MENLVKKYLLENDLLSSDKFVRKFFILGDEWEIYKLNDNTLLYTFFELTDDGWGYVFCVKIKCEKLKYNADYFYYVKSSDSFIKKDWEDYGDYIRDQLMFDAINRLKAYSMD